MRTMREASNAGGVACTKSATPPEPLRNPGWIGRACSAVQGWDMRGFLYFSVGIHPSMGPAITLYLGPKM